MARIVDTNIIIYYLSKKKKEAREILEGKIAISVITRMELLSGMKNTEKKWLEGFLLQTPSIQVTNEIADIAAELLRKHSKLKRRQADALIAATAIYQQAPLVTANVKDFKNIPELTIEAFSV
jgi:predicted nucleic acid-binding protein